MMGATVLGSMDLRWVLVLLASLQVVESFAGQTLPMEALRKGVYAFAICICLGKVVQAMVGNGAGRAVRSIDPVRVKQTELGRSTSLEWASSEMQGWRPAMEDAVCIVASLPEPLSRCSLFAVFDGHGGKRVSAIAAQQLPKVVAGCAQDLLRTGGRLSGELAKKAGLQEDGPIADEIQKDGQGATEVTGELIEKALHAAMLTMDVLLREIGAAEYVKDPTAAPNCRMPPGVENDKPRNAFDLTGSTAIVAILDHGEGDVPDSRPSRVIVANCGDSRAVLCRQGTAVELSEDHKPELPAEEARIRNAGGHVETVHGSPCPRVDGWGLNLSRALGDFHYKARADLPPDRQKVVAVPDIRTLEIDNEDEFLLLGCDGIFELNSSQGVIDLVRHSLGDGATLQKAVEHLLDKSCSPNPVLTQGKGMDNCSAILVRFST